MLLIEFGLNGRPYALTWRASSNTALMRRRDMRSSNLH
jgi:hypothetical protein